MKLNMRHDQRINQPARGVALVSVLWVLILLSLMAVAISTSSRSTGRLTDNLRYATQARYAAEAGLQWAYWGMLIPEEQIPWLADGSIYEMQLEDMQLQVSVHDENGKIDLNAATIEVLQRLLVAADVDEARVDYVVDAILDWRDEDDLKRLNGAEDDDYLVAGLGWEAKDAAFETIDELKQVLGMDEQIYRSIQDSVTVYSGRLAVNPLVAPRLVLLALSEADETEVDQYIEERRRLHNEGQPPPEGVFTSSFFSASLRGLNYTIHTQAVIDPRIKSRLTVVVRRQGRQGRRVFKILNMKQKQEQEQEQE